MAFRHTRERQRSQDSSVILCLRPARSAVSAAGCRPASKRARVARGNVQRDEAARGTAGFTLRGDAALQEPPKTQAPPEADTLAPGYCQGVQS